MGLRDLISGSGGREGGRAGGERCVQSFNDLDAEVRAKGTASGRHPGGMGTISMSR